MTARATADLLDGFVRRMVDLGRFPGAAWQVTGPDGVASGCAGVAARLPVARPLTADTPYDLASLTKPLATAPLLATLVRDGVLGLDDPVDRHLPELRASPQGDRSLRELALHVAGLPDWRPLYLGGSGIDAYLQAIARLQADSPGRVVYSDLGYVLLGEVCRRAGGADLSELFERRIVAPLAPGRIGFPGERDTFDDAAAVEVGNAFERQRAPAAAAADHPWRTRIPPGEVHDANAHGLGGSAGHAGLFGTCAAVGRLARALVAPGALDLPGALRDALTREGAPGRTVGWELASANRAVRGLLPPGWVGHLGFTGTSVWLDPAGVGQVVLLTNRVHPHVGPRDFQVVRRGFHRIARRGCCGDGAVANLQ